MCLGTLMGCMQLSHLSRALMQVGDFHAGADGSPESQAAGVAAAWRAHYDNLHCDHLRLLPLCVF